MPRFQLPLHFDTLLRNGSNFFFHYDTNHLVGQFKEVEPFIDQALRSAETIRSNRDLSPEGREKERKKTEDSLISDINKWLTGRFTGLDADISSQRAALAPQAVKVEPARHDALARSLVKFTPQERMVFYSSAPDDVRAEMEAVSAALGPLPVRNGQALEWHPLLGAAAVNESVMGRAQAKNPKAVAKLREVQEIRQMTQTIADIAISDVKAAMALALTA